MVTRSKIDNPNTGISGKGSCCSTSILFGTANVEAELFMHPRLATINNLMTFAGAHNNPRYVDVYDSRRKVWARKSIWGNLFVTGKDGQVVLSWDGSEIRKH
jgi:hypothetical protein